MPTTRQVTRYGNAKSPAPIRAHTCKVRTKLDKGWRHTDPEKCPGCITNQRERWPELVASLKRG